MAKQNFQIYSDGGARGNPGPAAIGFVVQTESGEILYQRGEVIGEATNNVAEYTGVIRALEWLQENVQADDRGEVHFFLDSNLVVNQLNGLFKIKQSHLRELVLKVRELEMAVGGNVRYQFIRREKNFLADKLLNEALDEKAIIKA